MGLGLERDSNVARNVGSVDAAGFASRGVACPHLPSDVSANNVAGGSGLEP